MHAAASATGSHIVVLPAAGFRVLADVHCCR
ncbi:Ms4533A family Cys-rich leader peptide [Mycolicibacterium goodii]